MNPLTKLIFLSAAIGSSSLQASLVLNIAVPDKTNIALNTPVVFAGTITNNSGASITTSDLFFNFSGFTPGALSLSEAISAIPVTIGDGTTSTTLSLFSATLLSGAQSSLTYRADVILQDLQGDVTSPVTISLSGVPEPSTFVLLLLGTGALFTPVVIVKGGVKL